MFNYLVTTFMVAVVIAIVVLFWPWSGIVFAAVVVVVRRSEVSADLRLMAVLAIAVTAIIAVTAPAALPSDQPQAWASGRYLDGMITMFFVAGAAVLLRADRRQVLGCAAVVVPATVLTAIAVVAYAGSAVPADGFSAAFNFAEPAVLTQNWMRANVALATAVGLGLRRRSRCRPGPGPRCSPGSRRSASRRRRK